MLTVFNTLTRKKEAFKPITDKKVGIYSCGPEIFRFFFNLALDTIPL